MQNLDSIMDDVRSVIETAVEGWKMPDGMPECYIKAITDKVRALVEPMFNLIADGYDQVLYEERIEYLEEVITGLQKEDEERKASAALREKGKSAAIKSALVEGGFELDEDEHLDLIAIFNNYQKEGG